MSFQLFPVTSRLEARQADAVVRTHLDLAVTRFGMTDRTQNEYRNFCIRIHDVLGLNLTEVNHQTGWFFDPDNIAHVSHSTVRALFELIGRRNIEADRAKALRMLFKQHFEAREAEAVRTGTRKPKKLGRSDVRAIEAAIENGEVVLLRNMDPSANTARSGVPFSTVPWIVVPN